MAQLQYDILLSTSFCTESNWNSDRLFAYEYTSDNDLLPLHFWVATTGTKLYKIHTAHETPQSQNIAPNSEYTLIEYDESDQIPTNEHKSVNSRTLHEPIN